MNDLKLVFRSLKGLCHGNQFWLGKSRLNADIWLRLTFAKAAYDKK